MRSFWRRHRALRILSYIVLAFHFLLCALPYLIPLGQPQAEISPDDLVGEHGRFLTIDGVNIYVEERNPESAQSTIMFIHGFGGPTFSWRHNTPFFADQGYRVVGLELRRFGLSYKDFASDHSHPAQAGLLAEIIARMEIDQAYFVGHSMGTSVMFHLAHLCPEEVLRFIRVGGTVGLDSGTIRISALLNFPPFPKQGTC